MSLATSTAMAEVAEVIVARIRFWWTPCPSWTSEYSLSLIHGMSRDTASSTIACVDGPNAVRTAARRNRSSSWANTNAAVGATSSLTSRTASSPAATPTFSSENA